MGDSVESRPSASEPTATDGGDTKKGSDASGVHAASTHVTIAWPFSQIKMQEASAELKELADLLSDLLKAMSNLVPEKRLAPLRERAEALRARLR